MPADPIDELCRRRFEQSRRSDRSVSIEDCLPPDASASYLPTLEELVLIDLEFGWKEALAAGTSGPLVETYLARFPRLNQHDRVLRLLRYEYELRAKGSPSPSLEEYRERFPEWVTTGREIVSDATVHSPATDRAREPERLSDVALW